jgi:hypothetical protein
VYGFVDLLADPGPAVTALLSHNPGFSLKWSTLIDLMKLHLLSDDKVYFGGKLKEHLHSLLDMGEYFASLRRRNDRALTLSFFCTEGSDNFSATVVIGLC